MAGRRRDAPLAVLARLGRRRRPSRLRRLASRPAGVRPYYRTRPAESLKTRLLLARCSGTLGLFRRAGGSCPWGLPPRIGGSGLMSRSVARAFFAALTLRILLRA